MGVMAICSGVSSSMIPCGTLITSSLLQGSNVLAVPIGFSREYFAGLGMTSTGSSALKSSMREPICSMRPMPKLPRQTPDFFRSGYNIASSTGTESILTTTSSCSRVFFSALGFACGCTAPARGWPYASVFGAPKTWCTGVLCAISVASSAELNRWVFRKSWSVSTMAFWSRMRNHASKPSWCDGWPVMIRSSKLTIACESAAFSRGSKRSRPPLNPSMNSSSADLSAFPVLS
mmetsp:Transcript_38946/g.117608  ORF Transcript_38946/g.117608 Transcript_38946/m.117608 type:complete len:233 (+) Transcript_38946:490-1188(+)